MKHYSRVMFSILIAATLMVTAVSKSWAEADTRHALANQLVDLTLSKQMCSEAHGIGLVMAITCSWPPNMKHDSMELIKAYLEVQEAFLNDLSYTDKVRESAVQLYERLFTESELREIIEFYKSNTGQKAMVNMTRMAQQALFMLNTQNSRFPAKYEQMLLDKIDVLKAKGRLPKDFKVEGPTPTVP